MKKKSLILLIIGIVYFTLNGMAQDAVKRFKNYNLQNGIALRGYDAVSYHTGKPTKGNPSYKLNYKGVAYLFTSANNLELFKKEPDKYEPTYGGWCAYAIGKTGEKVDPDPTNYKLENGKVYLFYKSFFSNTLDDWNKDEASLKSKAEANWPNLLK
jgi:YHS domain-containing protein